MNNNGSRETRRERLFVVVIASLVSILAFCWYFSHGELLLYGDAVAHINIARRVFDSRSPGPLQLGTVWLPLPHVAMIPFLVNDWMWRTGVGGAIPSMIAYVLGVFGVYRLVRGRQPAYIAGAAAAIYGLNPNLLYMQTTAMNEPMLMAELAWALVYLDELKRALHPPVKPESTAIDGQPALAPYKSIERCGMVLAAAILTRYDGWVLAAACGVALIWLLWRGRRSEALRSDWPRIRRAVVAFFALCAVVPVLWLAQNYALSARPLDFINGPYSAKAIEARTSKAGYASHPGAGHPLDALLYFFQSAKLNVAPYRGSLPFMLLVFLGTAYALVFRRTHGVWMLLWFPLPFYVYAVAYGSVPIFMPVWWPHSYYNVRYGLEMLPCFAVFAAIAIGTVGKLRFSRPALFTAVIAGFLVVVSYLPLLPETPICLREARVNSRSRIALEETLAGVLSGVRPDSTVLIYTGEYVGALQRAGIPLRQTINETIHPAWEEALSHPGRSADFIVAVAGDDLWYATRLFPNGLEKIAEFQVPGKPRVIVYRGTAR